VAESNKEIITLIGRRLRDATEVERAKLPDSIQRGLDRLGELGAATAGDRDIQCGEHAQTNSARTRTAAH
jgi:hypothetical protein